MTLIIGMTSLQSTSEQRWLWPFIITISLLKLIAAGTLELSEDEAYYWCWSQQLDWGYFDHPPMIAYFISLGTKIFGHTELGVRVVGILLGIPMLVLCHRMTRGSLLAVCLVGTMPLYMLGGILSTPDVPLLLMWLVGLWATKEKRWLILGVAAGLAMMSKYTGALLFPLMMASSPKSLKNPRVYVGLLLALLTYAPNIYWNLVHDGISWEFQLHHIRSEPRRFDFLGAQFGLTGPIIFILLIAWMIGGPKTPLKNIALFGFLPLLAIAIYSGGEANWAAPAYLGALLALSECRGIWRKVAWTGVGVNLFLCLVVLIHAQKPLTFHPNDPLHRLTGGKTLGDSIAAWGTDNVVTTRYQEAALIRFYGGVDATVLPEHGRLNQFEFWAKPLPKDGIFVRPFRLSPVVEIQSYGYETQSYGRVVSFAQGATETKFHQIHAWQVYPFSLQPDQNVE